MNARTHTTAGAGTNSAFFPSPGLLLQRKCACGAAAAAPCEECKKGSLLQRSAREDTEHDLAPPVVRDVLSSAGEPLDPTTRSRMEERLGHRFGQVRIHHGERAAESARAVQARAYTVGRHVVFGAGEWSPHSSAGRGLLAHELGHVAQQAGAAETVSGLRVERPGSAAERAAERIGRAAGLPAGGSAVGRGAGASLQRQVTPEGQVGLTLDGSGKVSVTVSGPNMPVVNKPTIGIRRNPDGTYDLILGSGTKTVAASEIPGMLRGMAGASASGGKAGRSKQAELRVPTCQQLEAQSGMRYKSWAEYQSSQFLLANPLPLTPALYDALLSTCPPPSFSIPEPAPPPEFNDLPGPTEPEGTAAA